MLGTHIGDIVGLPYEFSHFKGKDVAPIRHGIPEAVAAEAWYYLPKDMQAVINALYKEVESPT